jgi:hypothetical protein
MRWLKKRRWSEGIDSYLAGPDTAQVEKQDPQEEVHTWIVERQPNPTVVMRVKSMKRGTTKASITASHQQDPEALLQYVLFAQREQKTVATG